MKTSISKRKLIGMTKYNLFGTWGIYISLGAVMFANLIVAIIIGLVRQSPDVIGGNIDLSMLGMAMALGAVIGSAGLKFALVNGVSRKTFFLSSGIALALLALAISLLVFLAMLITYNVGQTSDAYYFMYCMSGTNWAGMYLFELGFMALGLALGYFGALVIVRTRKRGKLIILVSFMVLAALMTLLGFLTDIWLYIGKALIYMFGLNFAVPNPFIGTASLIGITLLLMGGSFLLVRRLDLK